MLIRETKSMSQTERMESRNSNFLYQKNALNEHISQNKATPHIIDSGKSGIWSYRKWSNGVAECWGRNSYRLLVPSEPSQGAVYYSADYRENLPSGLFTSVTSWSVSTNDNWSWTGKAEANTSAVVFRVARGSPWSETISLVYAQFIIKGRWTEESSPEDYDDIPTVDQTFNPESANAQSGTAVAEAVELKADLNYVDNTFSNALKESKSGETFLLDDVSPISQDISVKVSGESISDLTTVKVQTYGKNLIPFPYSGLPAGTGTITINGVTFTVNEDGSVLVNGTAEANVQFNLSSGTKINTVNGVTYALSGCPSGGSSTSYFLRVYAGSYTFQDVGNGNIHVTIGEDTSGDYSYIAVRQGTIVNNLLFKPQFAVEDKVTEYEPYIAPTEYTPNSDGTVDGVTVIYPNTTFMTDTAGAIVDCEYNRDINKAYSSLLQRVAALEAAALNNV